MDASTFPNLLGFSQIPVAPPPDHNVFFKHHPSSHIPTAALTNPLLFRSFLKEMEAPMVKKAPSLLEKHLQQEQQKSQQKLKEEKSHTQKVPQQCCSTPATCESTLASSTSNTSSAETKVPPQHSSTKTATPATPQSPPVAQTQHTDHASHQNPFAHPTHPTNLLDPTLLTTDPKYAQLVARMAAYYQQRCQAILNYQQQRCQTWANTHRAKCQEMMQAAMLVVAWYIRDRIGRRRRRNKRAFRRGLRERTGAGTGAGVGAGRKKGEAVRKWVLGVAEGAAAAPPPLGGKNEEFSGMLLDAEERAFDVEKEVVPDKDGQLFSVADQMIKSQLAKIDVPLLGALNLDESEGESESESEAEGGRYYYEPEDYDMDDGEEEEEEYDDEYEDEEELDYEEEAPEDYAGDIASKEAMDGTGKGSLKRKRSESTSVS